MTMFLVLDLVIFYYNDLCPEFPSVFWNVPAAPVCHAQCVAVAPVGPVWGVGQSVFGFSRANISYPENLTHTECDHNIIKRAMAKVTQIGLALQIMLNFGVAYRDAGYPYSECI